MKFTLGRLQDLHQLVSEMAKQAERDLLEAEKMRMPEIIIKKRTDMMDLAFDLEVLVETQVQEAERAKLAKMEPSEGSSLKKRNDIEEPAPIEVQQDMVNSPSHYTTGGIEVRDYIKAKLNAMPHLTPWQAYCIGTTMKYLPRAGVKDPNKFLEDIQKASTYLKWSVEDEVQ